MRISTEIGYSSDADVLEKTEGSIRQQPLSLSKNSQVVHRTAQFSRINPACGGARKKLTDLLSEK